MAPLKLETAIRAFRGSSFAIAILLNKCFESLGRDPHTFVGRFRDEVSDLLRLLWHGNLAGGSLPAFLSLTFAKRLVWTPRPTGVRSCHDKRPGVRKWKCLTGFMRDKALLVRIQKTLPIDYLRHEIQMLGATSVGPIDKGTQVIS